MPTPGPCSATSRLCGTARRRRSRSTLGSPRATRARSSSSTGSGTWRPRPASSGPIVSNTERVNRALGLPAPQFTTRIDPDGGVERYAEFRKVVPFAWREHPFEWIEGQRFGVLARVPARGLPLVPQPGRAGAADRRGDPAGPAHPGLAARTGRDAHGPPPAWPGRTPGPGEGLSPHRRGRDRQAGPARESSIPSRSRRRLDDSGGPGWIRASTGWRRCGVDPAGRRAAGRVPGRGSRSRSRADPAPGPRRPPGSSIPTSSSRLACTAPARGCSCCSGTCSARSAGSRARSRTRSARSAITATARPATSTIRSISPARSSWSSASIPRFARSTWGPTASAGRPIRPTSLAQVRVAAGERIELALELPEGSYRIRGPQLPWSVDFQVTPNAPTRLWEIDLATGPGPDPPRTLRAGHQVLTLANGLDRELLVRIERTAVRTDALTAARAASLALFRELFPGEVLSPGQLATVSTVTLLAVELDPAQADALYHDLGDARAFNVIHELFRLLDEAIREAGGAVVKTVGEGLLAAFQDPAPAVRLGLELEGRLARSESTREPEAAASDPSRHRPGGERERPPRLLRDRRAAGVQADRPGRGRRTRPGPGGRGGPRRRRAARSPGHRAGGGHPGTVRPAVLDPDPIAGIAGQRPSNGSRPDSHPGADCSREILAARKSPADPRPGSCGT